MSRRARTAAAAFAALVVAAGCSRGDDRAADRFAEAEAEAGPVHVHGLGINPADDALYIATHTGMWRLAPGARRAERVGERHQDTMGFTVVGPNRFLGSGHPDARDNLPPHLGLIASNDAGRTWTPVSLLGRADFHALRASGRYVYGFDVLGDRLLVSRNGGRDWTARPHPQPVFDLAIHPSNPKQAVAATAFGLFATTDEARTWRMITPQSGFVAWPAPDLLYIVTPAGEVMSRGAAGTWRRVGNVAGEPGAFLAASRRELYVALHDGTIKRSVDGGRSWRVRATA